MLGIRHALGIPVRKKIFAVRGAAGRKIFDDSRLRSRPGSDSRAGYSIVMENGRLSLVPWLTTGMLFRKIPASMTAGRSHLSRQISNVFRIKARGNMNPRGKVVSPVYALMLLGIAFFAGLDTFSFAFAIADSGEPTGLAAGTFLIGTLAGG